MAEIKKLLDEYGIIYEGNKILPIELKVPFLESLAELEDNNCHKTRNFPKTRLRKVAGIKDAIYRTDINKISGWRLHLQYGKNNTLILKDIICGQKHDDVIKVIKSKKNRYD